MQRDLAKADAELPIIFITGYGDIPMSVRAMKAGAVEFLTKPFRDQDLIDRINQALEKDAGSRRMLPARNMIRKRLESLTPREREVMALVVTGMLNKQIADDLGISIKTVEAHRANIMEKLNANTVADLLKIALGANAPANAANAK